MRQLLRRVFHSELRSDLRCRQVKTLAQLLRRSVRNDFIRPAEVNDFAVRHIAERLVERRTQPAAKRMILDGNNPLPRSETPRKFRIERRKKPRIAWIRKPSSFI